MSKNNLQTIIERVYTIVSQLAPTTTGEEAEIEIMYCIADEIIDDIGIIEQRDSVKKALINMFLAGQILKNK